MKLEVVVVPVVGEVFHDTGGVFHHAGTTARVSGPAPEHQTYGSWPGKVTGEGEAGGA